MTTPCSVVLEKLNDIETAPNNELSNTSPKKTYFPMPILIKEENESISNLSIYVPDSDEENDLSQVSKMTESNFYTNFDTTHISKMSVLMIVPKVEILDS